MRTLLDVLQNLTGHPSKTLTERLGITEQEYKQIESGETQMSLRQMTALAELIKANTDRQVPGSPVAIYYGNHYNYNFGPKSRGINTPNTYTENDYTNKPQNHETTNPNTNG